MEQGSDIKGAAWRARLREAALSELDRTGLFLRFEEPLRGMYAASQARTRPRELTWVTHFGCVAFITIVMMINLLIEPTVQWWIVAPQILIPVPIAIVGAQVFFRPERSERVREGWALLSACLFSLATIIGVTFAEAETALPDFYLATLPVIFVLIFIRPRFEWALVFTAFSAGALAAALYYRAELPPNLRAYPLGFLIAAAVPALAAVHGLEAAARKVYLHGVLQGLQIEELAQQNERLEALSNTDALTGIANRRRLDAALAERTASPLTDDYLLLIDIDHFRHFNDLHGHLAGDACLRGVAQKLAAELRPIDLIARFGGEEFAILVPRASLPWVLELAERLRAAVAGFRPSGAALSEALTISIGIADRTRDSDAALLIARADAALYAAKRAGRNCIRRADQVWGHGGDTNWGEQQPGDGGEGLRIDARDNGLR